MKTHNTMDNGTDIKIWTFNLFALFFSFTDVDAVLKFSIMIVTVGYTSRKWYLMEKNKDKVKKDED